LRLKVHEPFSVRNSRIKNSYYLIKVKRGNKKDLILGHREHIKLYEACDLLLSTSKDSGAYDTLVTAANRFKDYFSNIILDEIAYSTPSLPLIPEQDCHPFQTKAATDSRAKLPPSQVSRESILEWPDAG